MITKEQRKQRAEQRFQHKLIIGRILSIIVGIEIIVVIGIKIYQHFK